jgi:hypothetical protein
VKVATRVFWTLATFVGVLLLFGMVFDPDERAPWIVLGLVSAIALISWLWRLAGWIDRP